MTALEPYQTNLLFLLVGANPLPNYVAALLLARPEGTIYLLHSEGPKGTHQVAERLRRAILAKRQSAQVIPHGIDETKGERIESKIEQITSGMPGSRKSVGLNYTGGTKPMAVHAHHAVSRRFPEACFSYLDARTLCMVVRRADQPTQLLPVGQSVHLRLEELLALHGYAMVTGSCAEPKPAVLCQTIANLHSEPGAYAQWRAWLERLATSPGLPCADEYPALQPVLEATASVCSPAEPSDSALANVLGFDELRSASKFLISGWLEHYTYHELASVSREVAIGDYAVEIKPKRTGKHSTGRSLDLDVAAMCGYQLFAISCMVTEIPEKAKEHLFEVFVRARQLGGDEARFGLVCCVQDPVSLQYEVQQDWDAEGKIRVFGRRDLLALADRMKDWFRTANKEVT